MHMVSARGKIWSYTSNAPMLGGTEGRLQPIIRTSELVQQHSLEPTCSTFPMLCESEIGGGSEGWQGK